jgi:hypothetical protein
MQTCFDVEKNEHRPFVHVLHKKQAKISQFTALTCVSDAQPQTRLGLLLHHFDVGVNVPLQVTRSD